MPETSARWYTDCQALVDQMLRELGNTLVVALPLGLGKPVPLVNALYQRAKADPGIDLTFLTALSLERPAPADDLRGRFLEPVFQRLYEGCPALDYMADLGANRLPANITIKEFFFQPGSRLGNFHAQYHYISSNYTHAARDVADNGCNVVMQLVARRETEDGETRLSMSCNPDTSAELIDRLRQVGRPFLAVAVINEQLPYMCGDAEVLPDDYDLILQGEEHSHPLFSVPKLPPVEAADYLLGLNASCLVPDGGTLQIGIGALGDAVAYALCLRQQNNAAYRDALIASGVLTPENRGLVKRLGGTGRFEKGLYGATEMLVEGFLALLEAGVLKREVYDFWALQILVNEGRCDPDNLDSAVLEGMAELGVREIRGKDFAILQHHGLFIDSCRYHNGYITAPDGARVAANMADPHSRRVMAQCLGSLLRNGQLLHGGFFLGSRDFYRALRDLPETLRRKINMTGVNKINQLDHNPRLYRAQRVHARFINTGLKATLNGAVVSDTLQSGQVLSGVGGQYNFVSMAHQLLTGRSILMIRAVRQNSHHSESNIVWEYGACTIPRHLRDMVITEYGMADVRGKSDGEVIKALLNVADSRFQDNLLARAISAGKVEPDYQIPPQYRDNTPARVQQVVAALRKQGDFPAYPFGSDFTEEELRVAGALKSLAALREASKLRLVLKLLRPQGKHSRSVEHWLRTLGLAEPRTVRERLESRLLSQALKQALSDSAATD